MYRAPAHRILVQPRRGRVSAKFIPEVHRSHAIRAELFLLPQKPTTMCGVLHPVTEARPSRPQQKSVIMFLWSFGRSPPALFTQYELFCSCRRHAVSVMIRAFRLFRPPCMLSTSQGISGRMVFGERLPALWFCGASLVVSGVVLLTGGSSLESDKTSERIEGEQGLTSTTSQNTHSSSRTTTEDREKRD